jgi:hypothetical protein
VAVDGSGTVYVTDTGYNRVLLFKSLPLQCSSAIRCHRQLWAFNTERSWHGKMALTVPVSVLWPRRILNSHDWQQRWGAVGCLYCGDVTRSTPRLDSAAAASA